MTNEELNLLQLAQRIWNELEAPSDDDMETVFLALIRHDAEILRNFLDKDRNAE